MYFFQLHAEYCESKYFKSEYKALRVAQMFQLSEFIRLSGTNCDCVVLTGDLNTQPQEIGYSLVTAHANLSDAWIATVNSFYQ